MTGVQDYKKPTRQQLEEMSLEQAADIDKRNREAYAHNRRLVEAAKSIVLDVEPTLRTVRDMICPPPEVEYAKLWEEIQEAKKPKDEEEKKSN